MRKDEGVDGDAQPIPQMVWMLFIIIFADKEEEWKISRKEYKSPLLAQVLVPKRLFCFKIPLLAQVLVPKPCG